MALFGAPRAHDDDPIRAARAALDIHEALAQLSENSSRLHQAHIGIASGVVVAGTVGRVDGHDYTVVGDSVNLAARLVAAAAPGQTLVSDSVYRALSGRGVFDVVGEIELKGFNAPVSVWRLRDISAEVTPTSRSSFVGRQAELEQFKSIVNACLGRGGGHVVYVRGEAGIGKTRLVEEMRRVAEAQGFTTHRSLVLDFGVGKSQDPVRSLLWSLLDLSPFSDPEERRRAAERRGAGSTGVPLRPSRPSANR
jgi:hypothetical protein